MWFRARGTVPAERGVGEEIGGFREGQRKHKADDDDDAERAKPRLLVSAFLFYLSLVAGNSARHACPIASSLSRVEGARSNKRREAREFGKFNAKRRESEATSTKKRKK